LWSSLPREDPLLPLAPLRLPCRAGAAWRWDGVDFRFLHPAIEALDDPFVPANRQSCVLKIESAHGSVLLAGDIDRVSERRLLGQMPVLLRADVLLVSHHGSTTSSTPEFVRAVAPRYAVFTVGYRNRFAHPREEVVQRYRDADSAIFRSDRSGAVSFRFGPAGVRVEEHRSWARRYWHDE
jgi:competence protein ComEC